MLRITVNGEDRAKVKSIISNSDFFKNFDLTETDEGFELDGMKYCTISYTTGYGQFTFIGEQDMALNDVVSDVFKEVPGIEVKGSLLLGSDNYRHFYWMYSAAGTTETTVDYAIDISEFGSVVERSSIGAPLSSSWYFYLYGTDFGTEYVFFKTLDELRGSVNLAISDCSINENDGLLGLDHMEIYRIISEIIETSASDVEDLKDIFEEIRNKYEKEDTTNDRISGIIMNNLVPMASAIDGMSLYEVWANAVSKKLHKQEFLNLFHIDDDLEDDDYLALLSQLAEDYEGFAEIEYDDFTDLCDEYGISINLEEENFDEIKENIENLNIPEVDEDWR